MTRVEKSSSEVGYKKKPGCSEDQKKNYPTVQQICKNMGTKHGLEARGDAPSLVLGELFPYTSSSNKKIGSLHK